jgi:hypothetical protein
MNQHFNESLWDEVMDTLTRFRTEFANLLATMPTAPAPDLGGLTALLRETILRHSQERTELLSRQCGELHVLLRSCRQSIGTQPPLLTETVQ